MGIAQIVITVLLALLVRRQWPGLAWLALLIAADVAALILLPTGDPRRATMVPHILIHVMTYAVLRAARRWRETNDGKLWGHLAWQLGSLATFIKLTFYDGVTWTWWNWIIILPINAFLAEIWPLYWLLLRPLQNWLN